MSDTVDPVAVAADFDGGTNPGENFSFPRPFGAYILLQAFARGGMGEVYLAKSGGIAGLEKYCVLKKLRPELTLDREYVQRFIDEAKVVVQLNHANIAQVFDVGRVVNEYYLAMEYVSGRDLRSLSDQAIASDTPLPISTTLLIMSEILEALDYAHRRKHPMTGEDLGLVHRDVSPQNVLLSFEGEVKLIDFGLAQSSMKAERTSPNIVMGKMAYMAPEQARGDPIDARADLFAVGVMLYEMVAGERFYEGKTVHEIWSVVGRGGYRPDKWNELDPELRAVLDLALHEDRESRFKSCGDFEAALTELLHTNYGGKPARSTLRLLVDTLYPGEADKEREMFARFGRIALKPDEAEASRSMSVSLLTGNQSDETTISGDEHIITPPLGPHEATEVAVPALGNPEVPWEAGSSDVSEAHPRVGAETTLTPATGVLLGHTESIRAAPAKPRRWPLAAAAVIILLFGVALTIIVKGPGSDGVTEDPRWAGGRGQNGGPDDELSQQKVDEAPKLREEAAQLEKAPAREKLVAAEKALDVQDGDAGADKAAKVARRDRARARARDKAARGRAARDRAARDRAARDRDARDRAAQEKAAEEEAAQVAAAQKAQRRRVKELIDSGTAALAKKGWGRRLTDWPNNPKSAFKRLDGSVAAADRFARAAKATKKKPPKKKPLTEAYVKAMLQKRCKNAACTKMQSLFVRNTLSNLIKDPAFRTQVRRCEAVCK